MGDMMPAMRAPPAPGSARRWETDRAWILVLVLACVAVFGRAVSYGFVAYDDDAYVYDNRMVQQGLSWATVRWAFAGQHLGHYHPLTWISHLMDVALFGLDARGHHATSLLLHTATTLLLFLFLVRATGETRRAGAAALLFAVHPLHVEPRRQRDSAVPFADSFRNA